MAKYDLENLIDDVKSVLTGNLNTKIASINTEKGDSLDLKDVNASAYFLQELNSKLVNYDPFILYGVENLESIPEAPFSGFNFQLFVILVLADNGQDAAIMRRLLRYSRALKEVFSENWMTNQNRVKIGIESLVPVQFKLANSGKSHRAVGVILSGSMY